MTQSALQSGNSQIYSTIASPYLEMPLRSLPVALTERAARAARDTSRWYGRVGRFNEPPKEWISCRDFYIEHWRRFPMTAPIGEPVAEADIPPVQPFLAGE